MNGRRNCFFSCFGVILTEYGLEMEGIFAILPHMNGFRVTILTLLCLSVGLMFYAVLVLVPEWQGNYRAYESSKRIMQYDKKNDIHRRQMAVFDPNYESPEVEQARLGVEETERRSELTLNAAEENKVLESAKRREAEARAKAADDKAGGVSSATIGVVDSYDPEYEYIIIRPAVRAAFPIKAMLAVRRDKRIVCEAVVTRVDEETGYVVANVRFAQFATAADSGVDASSQVPAAGDEVIPSPFLSVEELRRGEGAGASAMLPGASDASDASDSDRIPPVPDAPPAFLEEGADLPADAGSAAQPPAAPPSEEALRAMESISSDAPSDNEKSDTSLPSLDSLLHPVSY